MCVCMYGVGVMCVCVCVDFDFCISFQLPNGVGSCVKFIH